MAYSESERYTAAGGIVVDRGRVLILRRASRDEVRLPKGHVEPGESPEQTALRETCEESGYCGLVVLATLGTQRVEFEQQGRHIIRDEHFFLLGLRSEAQLGVSEPQFQSTWLPWSEAESELTFEAEREWVRRARRAARVIEVRSKPAIALSTGSLYTYGLSRVFEVASRLGYDGVEILIDHRWDTRQAGYLRSLAASHSVPITSLHCPFADEVAGWPADELGRLHHTVALAHDLGVRVVVAHLPLAINRFAIDWHGSTHWRGSLALPRVRPSAYERLLLDGLASFEEHEGIIVCVENMPVHRIAGIPVNVFRRNTPEQLSAFPHVTLDTTHLASWGLNPMDVYSRLRSRVAHVHISNYDSASRAGHRAPQDGDVDLAAFVERLRRDQFGGQIVLEGSPSALQASDPGACERHLRSALAFCRGGIVSSRACQ